MITFSQKYLRQALQGLRVLKVNKQKLAPLHCVLVRGAGDTVTFEATNLDEYLRFEGRGETSEPAAQLVPYDLLSDALKSGDADSSVTINPGVDLSYNASGARLSVPLPEHKVEDFAPAPVVTGTAITLPAGVIASVVEAQGCASSDTTRYILNSVLLSPHEVVATDGRQLYRRNGLELALPKDGVLLPLSGVPGILQGDHAAELWVVDHEDTVKACVTQGPWRWITKVVAGAFPNWKQVVPRGEDYGSVIQLGAADATRLIAVLPRLPGFKESTSPVRLRVTAHGAELSPPARLPQVVVALDRSEVTGPNVTIQFNANLLLGALKRGFRELRVKDEFSPLFMRDDTRINLWMPIRLDDVPAPSAPAEPEASPAPVQSNQPNVSQPKLETNMVALKTPTPESPVAQPAAEPAPAARIAAPAETPSEASPLDTLHRAKDLLREVQNVLTEATNGLRDLAKEKRAVERDLEALKRNLRVLKSVEV